MTPSDVGSYLAPLNAILNATSAVFLFAGYLAIRARRIEQHRRRMEGAFIASGIFLVSYVSRFFLTGTHRFPDVGFVRTIYLAILSTHTLLAMAALPLVLITFWRARRGRFEQHRKIAKITFPIWAYVSVTGIIVYLMLYQLAPRLVAHASP